MACGDARRRHQLREESRQVEARQVRDLRRQQRGIDAGQIGAHGVVERAARAPAQGVEHSAVDLGRTEARDQRVEAERRPLGNLPVVMGGEMAERGARSGRLRIGGGGEHEREPQLLEIVLVGEREILVEPLGRQQLRRRSPMRAAVGKLDPHTHERLRRLGERDNAEPKGQAQAHFPFVEAHVSNVEEGCRHVRRSFERMMKLKENRRGVMAGHLLRLSRLSRRKTPGRAGDGLNTRRRLPAPIRGAAHRPLCRVARSSCKSPDFGSSWGPGDCHASDHRL